MSAGDGPTLLLSCPLCWDYRDVGGKNWLSRCMFTGYSSMLGEIPASRGAESLLHLDEDMLLHMPAYSTHPWSFSLASGSVRMSCMDIYLGKLLTWPHYCSIWVSHYLLICLSSQPSMRQSSPISPIVQKRNREAKWLAQSLTRRLWQSRESRSPKSNGSAVTTGPSFFSRKVVPETSVLLVKWVNNYSCE